MRPGADRGSARRGDIGTDCNEPRRVASVQFVALKVHVAEDAGNKIDFMSYSFANGFVSVNPHGVCCDCSVILSPAYGKSEFPSG